MDGDDTEPPRPTRLTYSLIESRRELDEIERDTRSGHVELSTALALAFVTGIEHARRLLLS